MYDTFLNYLLGKFIYSNERAILMKYYLL